MLADWLQEWDAVRKIVPQSSLPVSEYGKWSIRKLSVTQDEADDHYLRVLKCGLRRGWTPAGEYTWLYGPMGELFRDDFDWITMCAPLVQAVSGNVLMTGLGMGVALNAVARKPNVNRVTVVEIDADILGLVAPHFGENKIEFINADAFAYEPKEHFDFSYHDPWMENCPERVEEIYNRYAPYCTKQVSAGFKDNMEPVSWR